jgi:hypothetical protein
MPLYMAGYITLHGSPSVDQVSSIISIIGRRTPKTAPTMNKRSDQTERILSSFVSVREVLSLLQSDFYMGKETAAHYAGLSSKTLVSAPDLPKYKPNGKYVFRKSEIDAWLAKYRIGKERSGLNPLKNLEQIKAEFRGKTNPTIVGQAVTLDDKVSDNHVSSKPLDEDHRNSKVSKDSKNA